MVKMMDNEKVLLESCTLHEKRRCRLPFWGRVHVWSGWGHRKKVWNSISARSPPLLGYYLTARGRRLCVFPFLFFSCFFFGPELIFKVPWRAKKGGESGFCESTPPKGGKFRQKTSSSTPSTPLTNFAHSLLPYSVVVFVLQSLSFFTANRVELCHKRSPFMINEVAIAMTFPSLLHRDGGRGQQGEGRKNYYSLTHSLT